MLINPRVRGAPALWVGLGWFSVDPKQSDEMEGKSGVSKAI